MNGPMQTVTIYNNNYKDFKVPNQYVIHIIIRLNIPRDMLGISFLLNLVVFTVEIFLRKN